MSTVHWNLVVSLDTDHSVREFLASSGGGCRSDLSRFVEEAVRCYIFDRTVEDAKAANSNISDADLTTIVTEAVHWAREHTWE